MGTITTKQLTSLARNPGRWVSERISHGHGTLAFRGLADGEIAIYYRYVDLVRRIAFPLGRYDVHGRKGPYFSKGSRRSTQTVENTPG